MSAQVEEQQWHILDFDRDTEGSCALTIFVNGVRFHILADANNLDQNTEAGAEYHKLFRNSQDYDPNSSGSQHQSNKGTDSDSGVDVQDTRDDEKESKEIEHRPGLHDIEQTLKEWIVAPLVDSFEDLAPSPDPSKLRTLQDWYHCSTTFCKLAVSDDGSGIQAVEVDATPELLDRMIKLIPQTVVPNYISGKLKAPIFSSSDFYVLDSSDQPPGTPYHPCKVQHRESKEVYFLKVVDNTQPQATKREIDILRRIEDLKLHDKIRVPSLKGLVVFDNAGTTPSGKTRFMGFLQNDIPDPTPLTYMLSTDVPQEKRDAWAKEVDSVKDILHEHDIIWGDAKADNFMVDAEERLWIIDFGGGYTEGWIEEKLLETEEGDDIATEKIVNALKDPAANMENSENRVSEPQSVQSASELVKKRKRGDMENEADGEGERIAKSQRDG